MTERGADTKPKQATQSYLKTWLRKCFRQTIQTVIGLIAVMVLVFVLINWPFFVKNISFWWQTNISETWRGLGTEEALGEPDRLRIASLNIESPLVYIDNVGEGYFQDALAQGVVHYPGTAMPGELGNVFYFGHSSDFAYKPGDYKTVFALLPQIDIGTQIELTDHRGKQYLYEVFNTLVVSPTQTEVLSQGDKTEKLLTLQTSYPVGTALKRFIVQAKLVK